MSGLRLFALLALLAVSSFALRFSHEAESSAWGLQEFSNDGDDGETTVTEGDEGGDDKGEAKEGGDGDADGGDEQGDDEQGDDGDDSKGDDGDDDKGDDDGDKKEMKKGDDDGDDQGDDGEKKEKKGPSKDALKRISPEWEMEEEVFDEMDEDAAKDRMKNPEDIGKKEMKKLKKGKPTWSYKDAEQWAKDYPVCGGSRQSPINIREKHVEKKKGDSYIKDFMTYHKNKGHELKFVNNGYAIHTVHAGQAGSMKVDNTTYHLMGFNFHFPSEHKVNGHRYPGEIHFVHTADVEDPLKKMLIVAVFVNTTKHEKDQSNFFRNIGFTSHEHKNATKKEKWTIGKNLTKGEEMVVKEAKIDIKHDLKKQLKDFWHYKGSMTTPPCTESVEWLVSETPAAMYEGTIKQVKQLFPHGNARPAQKVANRTIIENRGRWPKDKKKSGAAGVSAFFATMLATFVAFCW